MREQLVQNDVDGIVPPPWWMEGRFPAKAPPWLVRRPSRLSRLLRHQSGGTTIEPVDPRLVEIGKSTYLRSRVGERKRGFPDQDRARDVGE